MEEIPFSKDELSDILRAYIPNILIQLLLNGKIDKSKISDPEYLWSKVRNDIDDLDSKIFYIVCFHNEFLEVAKDAYDNNKKMVAIVLIATAIEHILNVYYRQIMRFSGFSDEDITKIIKNNNFEDKTGWLMQLIFKKDLEPELRKEIKKIIDIRNAIVHYKAIPFALSDGGDSFIDSHSIIEKQIESLDFDILKIPEELGEVLDSRFLELNPELKIVGNMVETMFKDKK